MVVLFSQLGRFIIRRCIGSTYSGSRSSSAWPGKYYLSTCSGVGRGCYGNDHWCEQSYNNNTNTNTNNTNHNHSRHSNPTCLYSNYSSTSILSSPCSSFFKFPTSLPCPSLVVTTSAATSHSISGFNNRTVTTSRLGGERRLVNHRSDEFRRVGCERVIGMSRTDGLLYKARNQFTRKARYATATQTAWAPVGRTMRAVVPDGDGNAIVKEVPIPNPGVDEVLLKVSAVGVNRADVLQIAGKYAPPPNTTPVLGLEASGYLCDGRRVTALLTGGGFAEYVTVPRSTILPLPPRIMDVYSMSQLAAIPEAFIAAYHVLFDVGKLQPGYTVLINAAASGVGVSALQLASAVPNVTVIACAGSEYKLDACRELGAHHLINYRTQSMAQAVSSITGGEGIHLAIDCVGACQFREIERSLRKDARWVMYGLLSGAKHESIGLAGIVSKHLTLIGTTLRGRSLAQRGRIVRDFVDRFGDQFGRDGMLRPVIHAEYEGLDTAPEAFRDLQNNENIGKLVLTI